MNSIKNSGQPLVGLAITLLLAGCAVAASQTPVPTATPAVTPTMAVATPMPSPTPSAAATETKTDRTYVSGTMTCHIAGEGEPIASGEHQPNPLYIDCDFAMSDPRVTGTDHYELLATFVELEAVNGTSNFWSSTSTLTGQGGTWKGSGFGSEFVSEPIKAMTLYTNGTDLYAGQGAFAGLTYRVMWARERPMAAAGSAPYVVSGWIEPAT